MEKGDISNGHPPLYLFSLDTLVTKDTIVEKKRWRKEKKYEVSSYDWLRISAVWRFFMNTHCSLEVFDLGCSQEDMDKVLEDLDAYGNNPFRYASCYKDRAELARSLPYRPEVFGVFDLPEFTLMYGSWSRDFSKVMLSGSG